jgi:hypothetical protein
MAHLCLQPSLQCRFWHETDMPKYLGDVRCWVNSGNHMLALSFSGFDGGLNRSTQHFILERKDGV